MKSAHELAITEYKAWLKEHPKASRKKKIQTFDMYCDSALLKKHIYG